MKPMLAMAALCVLSACANHEPEAKPAGHQPAAEAEILAVMDAYMHEISANDLAAMQARQTPEGMTYRHRERADAGWEVLARSNMDWVAPDMASEQTFRERYWSPTVLIRGPMALVWAPYAYSRSPGSMAPDARLRRTASRRHRRNSAEMIGESC